MENHLMIKNSIILVQFPFDDFSVSKVRPALCLTTEIGKYNHVIIAFISSKLSNGLIDSDLIIRKQTENSIGTGFAVDSVIRLQKMLTIPTVLIKRKLGTINSSVQAEIEVKIRQLFGRD